MIQDGGVSYTSRDMLNVSNRRAGGRGRWRLSVCLNDICLVNLPGTAEESQRKEVNGQEPYTGRD
jgi:hypothetical protein